MEALCKETSIYLSCGSQETFFGLFSSGYDMTKKTKQPTYRSNIIVAYIGFSLTLTGCWSSLFWLHLVQALAKRVIAENFKLAYKY